MALFAWRVDVDVDAAFVWATIRLICK